MGSSTVVDRMSVCAETSLGEESSVKVTLGRSSWETSIDMARLWV